MKLLALVFVAGWSVHALLLQANPVLRVVDGPGARELLQNGGFELGEESAPAGWRPAPKGCQSKAGEGRNGSRALFCENESGEGWYGASQTVQLGGGSTGPLIVRGWSKALNVAGGSDSGYSLYVDLVYADGTPLWGQTAHFRAGTHYWERRQVVIMPEKPVRSVTVHCLFRGHPGKVWFDDVALEQPVQTGDALLFQGVAVRAAPVASPASTNRLLRSLDVDGGLRLSMIGETIASLRLGDHAFEGSETAGYMARDVAAESGFVSFEAGRCPELDLKLDARTIARSNHIVFEGRLTDLRGADRAVTLVFAVPLKATGWTWGDDLRRTRAISGSGEFANQVSVPCGATGTQSLYPIAAVWDKEAGAALALDMGKPAVYRVGYQAGLERLFISYDFALVKDTAAFPSSADFRFVLFAFDGKQGFRGAWAKYMEIFPDYFAVRSPQQGLWMPFTDVSKVPGWEDFGFRYHEGNNNVPWDDQHGILSFRYTEPMTWWMPMAKDVPRTLPEAIQIRDALAKSGKASQRRMAEVSRLAGMFDEAGEPALLFRNEPWANGAVWSLNPNPWLGGPSRPDNSVTDRAPDLPGVSNSPAPVINAATVYWNDEIKTRLYNRGGQGELDGEYLDSLEGYVTAELNFRREHFSATTVPLSFNRETHQPAIFKGLAVFEFTRWLAEDVHRMNRLMFANGVPYRFTYLCPWLDVLGTETDWLREGKYHPAALATMDLWRCSSGAKPYLLLMNTDYDRFTPDLVEKYFQRALFYGMWPGFFSHNASENPYWQNPRWIERDRDLFKKYIPLIKRVAEAGWHPIPNAFCQNENILVERYGPGSDGAIYLTLLNDQAERQTGLVSIDRKAFGLPATLPPHPLLGKPLTQAPAGWKIALEAQEAAVWQLQTEPERAQ